MQSIITVYYYQTKFMLKDVVCYCIIAIAFHLRLIRTGKDIVVKMCPNGQGPTTSQLLMTI